MGGPSHVDVAVEGVGNDVGGHRQSAAERSAITGPAAGRFDARGVLAMQRFAGNRAVGGLLTRAVQRTAGPRPRPVQPLPGGPATRPLPTAAPPAVGPSTATAGGQPDAQIPAAVAAAVGGIGVDLLRAALSPTAPPPAPDAVPLPSLGDGEPIPARLRAPFEKSYGYDFSPIRLHRGPVAQRATQAANAAAFTLGDHVVLGGNLDLGGTAGQHVLGHELAHTVQSRLGGVGSGRISDPGWPAEREAEHATSAALAGRGHLIAERGGDDLHRIAPWLILAGIGLAAGLIIWAASDSPEENERKHATGAPNASEDLWALIPVYGSMQQIREADSYFQRVLGVGFLMLDCATLGSAGVAGRALIKAPGALIRTAIARRGAVLAVKEGGEIATEAMAKETAAAFTREGGTLLASQAQATSEMLQALQRGSLVVVTEGGLNHAAIYAKNAAGQVMKVHGGPLKLMFTEATKEVSEKTAQSMAKRANAYLIIEAGETAVGIEQAAAEVSKGGPAALRWLGGNPTSCGIMQGALLEASGLSAETLGKLLPAGGAAGRMLPISILGQMATAGGLRFVEGGMSRIIGGTLIQGGTLALGGVTAGPMASVAMRFLVNEAAAEEPPADGALADAAPPGAKSAGPNRRTPESDDAAIAIVARFGRVLVGPASTVRKALPEIIPGFYIRSNEFLQEVKASLVHIGMDPVTARSIIDG